MEVSFFNMTKTSRPRPTHASLAQKARARRQSQQWLWGISALVLIAIVAIVFYLWRNNTAPATTGTTDANGQIVGLKQFSNLSRDHQNTRVTYAETPPVGGAHNTVWQNCGIYDQPVANENAVHSLEHGAVWITYRPDLPAVDIEKLRALVRGHNHALLTPYPNLPTPVVASAWGLQVQVQSVSDPRLPLFVSKYENGRQTPEPGAVCNGGVGSPVQQ